MKKVANQKLLARVVKKDSDWHFRLIAISNLTDQKVLAEVAKFDSELKVRREAIKKITDKIALNEVAKNAKYSGDRLTAIEHVSNQKVLSEIATNDAKKEVREYAIFTLGNLKNPTKNSVAVLVKSLDSPESPIQKAAATGLSNYASHSPENLLDNWSKILNKVTQHKDIPGKEIHHHNDYTPTRPNDCTHQDNSWIEKNHTDIGIGMEFPEKPPKL